MGRFTNCHGYDERKLRNRHSVKPFSVQVICNAIANL
jgi:hypothetical protein